MVLFNKIQKCLKNKILHVYLLLLLNIGLLLLATPKSIEYFCKVNFATSNILLLGCGTIICTTFLFFYRSEKNTNNNKLKVNFSYLLSGMIIVQLAVCYNIQFLTNWDVNMLLSNAKWIADGDYQKLNNGYFSSYPNNVLLVYCFSLVFKFLNLIGIDSFIKGVRLIVAFQCFLSIYTLWLLAKSVSDIVKSVIYTRFAVMIYVAIVGLSPWLVITYSDSIGLIFPILFLYLHQKVNDGNIFKMTVLMGVLSFIGYKIKPQVIFVCIAIVIVHLLVVNLSSYDFKRFIREMKIAIIFISAVILSNFVYQSFVVPSTYFKLNKEAEFGIAHYLMVGHDYTRGGVYSGRDVKFSSEIKTQKERTVKNMGVFKERIEYLKPVGLAKFYAKKTLTNFNDGTFAWGQEGGFYNKIFKNKNKYLSPFLRNIYYHNGKYYIYWSSFMQMIWLIILFFNGCLIFAREFVEKNKTLLVAVVSVIGLTIFETLFEARARYLYTYVPIYILLATVGCKFYIKRITDFINKILQVKRR